MKQPNILVLLADDQRFDTIRALGNPVIETPNLDALTAEGVSFTQAHIQGGTVGAVCMPSRAMLHTGVDLFHLNEHGETIPANHRLMGEAFQAAGYETFGTGKWHNGPSSYARSFTSGAEIFFGGMNDHWNVPAHSFDPSGAYESRIRGCNDAFHSNSYINYIADHLSPGKHSTELFADATIAFLESGRDESKPFFAYVAFMAPHDPRTMPDRFKQMYDPQQIDLPANFMHQHPIDTGALTIRDEVLAALPREASEIRRHIAEYYAMISHLDFEIGRIIDVLKERGEWENTILVFSGDNGLAVGQHGLMGKQNVYDHSMRVPLIVRGPGVKVDVRDDRFVFISDLFPSLCELLELETPDSCEAVSFASALRDAAGWSAEPGGSGNPRGETSAREELLLTYGDGVRGLRAGDFKYIRYETTPEAVEQLFCVADDRWELKNLVGDPAHGPRLNEMRDRLRELRRVAGDPGVG
ncbi:MAG: sulfatase-like hydrolase/transferase [Spirochaetales bacterium]